MTVRDEQRGAAERLLALVLTSSDHLWHNRPGRDVGGRWYPSTTQHRFTGTPVSAGLFVPAALALYGNLVEIQELDPELMARFASYAQTQTDWRDLKIACAALLLVQPLAGQPVRDADGTIAFYEDDFRGVGEAMVLDYRKGSTRMLTPKGVLRVAQLLEQPDIVELNRAAGFANPGSGKPPLGRWPSATRQWLSVREQNLPLLEGLVKAGFKTTIKQLVRKSGYRPASARFYEVLGWPQKQSVAGHRTVGLDGLNLVKRDRFDGLTERAICRRIADERLSFKEVVGRLPADIGLTPAIMAALLPSLSDRDLRQLTPTLESLRLLEDRAVKVRWDRAIAAATDQRSLNIAKNVRNRELRDQLEGAADAAARAAVREAVAGDDIIVMFLIDKSGSMEVAIDRSKEALSRILAGFPAERVHIASFDTVGTVLRPKAPTGKAVEHLLGRLKAEGGTNHAAGLHAFAQAGVRIPPTVKLILIVAGDENGEDPQSLARAMDRLGYRPSAIGLIVSVNPRFGRGNTVRGAAQELGVPFTEVDVEQFADPYQVTRVLQTLLEAPVSTGVAGHGWLEKVLATPLLEKPG